MRTLVQRILTSPSHVIRIGSVGIHGRLASRRMATIAVSRVSLRRFMLTTHLLY